MREAPSLFVYFFGQQFTGLLHMLCVELHFMFLALFFDDLPAPLFS